jgi:hypothetical protein
MPMGETISENYTKGAEAMARKITIIQTATIAAPTIKTPGEDVSDGNKLETQFTVDNAGTDGQAVLEHSNRDVDGEYVALSTPRSLTSAASYFEGFDHFMQYVRIKATGAAGGPVVTVTLLVK